MSESLALHPGAPTAFAEEVEAAFAAHGSALVAMLGRHAPVPHQAEDQVQEVFERIVRRPPSTSVLSWRALLARVGRSVVVDQIRRERVRQGSAHQPLDDIAELSDERPTPLEELIAKERLAHLKEALQQLEPLARDVVLLARIEGLSHKAIADRLGIEPIRVGRILYKAIARLADEVDRT